jgi:hypothetical protein
MITVKHGGDNIMLWSAITYAEAGCMYKTNGSMDKTLYKEILEDELERTAEYRANRLDLKRHQIIFQYNSDSKHASKLVEKYLKDYSYDNLKWPVLPSDLNSIENKMYISLIIRALQFVEEKITKLGTVFVSHCKLFDRFLHFIINYFTS